MTTFEIYMLTVGWDALGHLAFLIGFIGVLLCGTASMFIVVEGFPQKHLKISVPLMAVFLILALLAIPIPNCYEAMKMYSAKYGTAEVQKQIKILRGGEK